MNRWETIIVYLILERFKPKATQISRTRRRNTGTYFAPYSVTANIIICGTMAILYSFINM